MLAIAALIGLISFIVFAFRQGAKVKIAPKETPLNHTSGYGADYGGSGDQSSGHSL